MTKEILKDHTSRSWQALAGYTYYPTSVEQLTYLANAVLSGKTPGTPDWLLEDKLTSRGAVKRVSSVDVDKRAKLKALLGDT